MSFLLCRAMITHSDLEHARTPTEMESEHDLFEAKAVELSRQARRQRLVRLIGVIGTAWAGFADRLTRPGRDQHYRKDLLERLETMPSYMLKDIGVTRDDVGRFCHYNDYGMLVELVPEQSSQAKEKVREIAGHLARATA